MLALLTTNPAELVKTNGILTNVPEILTYSKTLKIIAVTLPTARHQSSIFATIYTVRR